MPPTIIPAVTLTIAAACAVINLWLAARIVPRRLNGVAVGDGGDPRMMAMTRAHANFAEYAPVVLILIGAIELSGGSATWLWIAGAVFVLGRIAHALGMPRPVPNPLRAGGILTTWAVTGLLAGWALALAYGAYAGARPVAVDTVPVEAPRG